jgi:formylglycine-generating enzyme required for sulfatase activity
MGPQRDVTISSPFYLGTHEVTRGQFRAFLQDTGHLMPRGGLRHLAIGKTQSDDTANWENPGYPQDDAHPVVFVNWHDAAAFIRWLNNKHLAAAPKSWKYALPTEAQWEYACRARTQGRFSCGDDDQSLRGSANLADASFRKVHRADPVPGWIVTWDDGFAFTAPVGSFQANPWGLFDMHGNVWEWCADQHDAQFYPTGPRIDPVSTSGDQRVIRGGSWFDAPLACRSAFRYRNPPETHSDFIGFRVALVAAVP